MSVGDNGGWFVQATYLLQEGVTAGVLGVSGVVSAIGTLQLFLGVSGLTMHRCSAEGGERGFETRLTISWDSAGYITG